MMTYPSFIKARQWGFRVSLLVLVTLYLFIPITAIADTTILMLGDSLTAGYGVEREQAFPALVESRLRALNNSSVRVINAGFSGSTTASALGRLRWYLRIKPDILVLALGGNDGLRGLGLESVKKNLASTIELAIKQEMIVVLAGMKIPPNYGDRYTRDFEAMYPALAKNFGVHLIPFLLEGVAGQVDLNIADGIHPNPEGHKIIAKTMVQYLLPILRESQGSVKKAQNY